MQPTMTNGRGKLVALLCAAACAGAAVPAIGAVANDDTPAATTQGQPSTLQVQDTTPADPAPGTGPDGRDCPEKNGSGAGGDQAPESSGTADSSTSDSTEL
jgi:hypothetical protein